MESRSQICWTSPDHFLLKLWYLDFYRERVQGTAWWSGHPSPITHPHTHHTHRELGVTQGELDLLSERVKSQVEGEVTQQKAINEKMMVALRQKEQECAKVGGGGGRG